MSVPIANSAEDQARRLQHKTRDARLAHLAVEGAGISPWEADVLVDVVNEVYFTEPEERPLQAGQMRYVCVALSEGAGKPLQRCKQQTVVLSLLDRDDPQVLAQQSADGLRRHRIQRLTEESRQQGGLLSQEDLAQLLCCSVRTIRRDIRELRERHGIMVATRGQQKDIGPTVSHKGVAIGHWLGGCEPLEVARKINHSLHAVERYLQHFSRVVFLAGKGFEPLQIALTVGISSANVKSYLEIHEATHWQSRYADRYREIALIGDQHFAAEEQKGACFAASELKRRQEAHMSKRLADHDATYGPQEFKSFPGALNAFFSTECPQLGGQRTRQVLVQSIVQMIERFYPPSSHLRPGQTPWVTVDKDEKGSYGKRMSQTRLTSVVLDLVPANEATERKEGKKLREIKKDAVARVFTRGYEQGGCLTNVETALLLKMSPSTVSKYTREWELEHGTLLPRRGTIHDMGPTLTHKKEIIERLFLQGKSVEQVMRETYHSAEAITRYIVAFKQVLLCHRKGLSTEEIAFSVKMSKRLVEEYLRLITELATKNQSLDRLIEDSLGSLLNSDKEINTV